MEEFIIDSHSHLWLRQDAMVDGQAVRTLGKNGSRSLFFGEERQMLPPFMIDGRNTAEVFLSNMDYAQVSAAVVVQEVIDGCQNEYLTEVQHKWPDRFFCMGMCHTEGEAARLKAAGLKGIAIPGHRLSTPLHDMMPVFKYMEREGMILSMCLGEDERQIAEMGEIIEECPNLKVAIGHFGMVTTSAFESQVKLALRGKNVMIESGGITWLFNAEFYPFPSAVDSIKQAADWVGIDRLMWGSDYPRTITAITYRMSYDFIQKSSEMSDADKAAFLGGNAKGFYGFDKLVELPYIKNMSE
ncbi:MAG: amidohydrolase family protein [Prevotella sp.]